MVKPVRRARFWVAHPRERADHGFSGNISAINADVASGWIDHHGRDIGDFSQRIINTRCATAASNIFNGELNTHLKPFFSRALETGTNSSSLAPFGARTIMTGIWL